MVEIRFKDSMVEQLKRVLNSVESEIESENSIWNKEQLIFVVKPEMEELYAHFKNGRVFFKYGKKQRMLESTHIMTDSTRNLSSTSLGKEIIKLQEKYNKL
jgi:alanine dehydrogenase